MPSVIQNMIANTIGDGARTSKFDCVLALQGLSSDEIPENELIYHVKTSQFPGKSVDVIDFKFKGRNIPIKGQVKYDNTWSCTFYLTEDHKLKHKIENWIEAIEQVHNMESDLSQEIIELQKEFANSYRTEMKIIQYDFNGTEERAIYTLHNVFPKSVSSVQVDHSQTGSILEFTVEFSYSHYTFAYGDVEDSKTKADTLKEKINTEITETVNKVKDDLADATSKFAHSEGGFIKKTTDAINDIIGDSV